MDDRMTTVINQHIGEHFTAINGDCVEVVGALPSNSVGLSVYSPPFAHLFVYSDSERDMGNVRDEAEFKALYRHMVREKYRVTKPGRLTAVHCSDLPARSRCMASSGSMISRPTFAKCMRLKAGLSIPASRSGKTPL
jgi:hypothetical protein